MGKFILMVSILMSVPCAFAHHGHHHGDEKPAEAPPAPDEKRIYAEIQEDYVKNVQPLLNEKCGPCHSSASARPWYAQIPGVGWWIDRDRRRAVKHLEIKDGFPFGGHGSVKENFEDLAEDVEKDEMPPLLYRSFHPSHRLASGEKATVLGWIQKSQERLGLRGAR